MKMFDRLAKAFAVIAVLFVFIQNFHTAAGI